MCLTVREHGEIAFKCSSSDEQELAEAKADRLKQVKRVKNVKKEIDGMLKGMKSAADYRVIVMKKLLRYMFNARYNKQLIGSILIHRSLTRLVQQNVERSREIGWKLLHVVREWLLFQWLVFSLEDDPAHTLLKLVKDGALQTEHPMQYGKLVPALDTNLTSFQDVFDEYGDEIFLSHQPSANGKILKWFLTDYVALNRCKSTFVGYNLQFVKDKLATAQVIPIVLIGFRVPDLLFPFLRYVPTMDVFYAHITTIRQNHHHFMAMAQTQLMMEGNSKYIAERDDGAIILNPVIKYELMHQRDLVHGLYDAYCLIECDNYNVVQDLPWVQIERDAKSFVLSNVAKLREFDDSLAQKAQENMDKHRKMMAKFRKSRQKKKQPITLTQRMNLLLPQLHSRPHFDDVQQSKMPKDAVNDVEMTNNTEVSQLNDVNEISENVAAPVDEFEVEIQERTDLEEQDEKLNDLSKACANFNEENSTSNLQKSDAPILDRTELNPNTGKDDVIVIRESDEDIDDARAQKEAEALAEKERRDDPNYHPSNDTSVEEELKRQQKGKKKKKKEEVESIYNFIEEREPLKNDPLATLLYDLGRKGAHLKKNSIWKHRKAVNAKSHCRAFDGLKMYGIYVYGHMMRVYVSTPWFALNVCGIVHFVGCPKTERDRLPRREPVVISVIPAQQQPQDYFTEHDIDRLCMLLQKCDESTKKRKDSKVITKRVLAFYRSYMEPKEDVKASIIREQEHLDQAEYVESLKLDKNNDDEDAAADIAQRWAKHKEDSGYNVTVKASTVLRYICKNASGCCMIRVINSVRFTLTEICDHMIDTNFFFHFFPNQELWRTHFGQTINGSEENICLYALCPRPSRTWFFWNLDLPIKDDDEDFKNAGICAEPTLWDTDRLTTNQILQLLPQWNDLCQSENGKSLLEMNWEKRITGLCAKMKQVRNTTLKRRKRDLLHGFPVTPQKPVPMQWNLAFRQSSVLRDQAKALLPDEVKIDDAMEQESESEEQSDVEMSIRKLNW